MEARDHSKNGTSPKCLISKGNLIIKLVLFCLTLFVSVEVWGQTSAEIEKIWVDYDVYENNRKGMRIHIKFSVEGMLYKKVHTVKAPDYVGCVKAQGKMQVDDKINGAIF